MPEPGRSGVTTSPSRRVMGTSTEDRARTSQPEVHCRVEEQALVEQEAEVEG